MIVEFGSFSHNAWERAVCYWAEGGTLCSVNKCIDQEIRLNRLRVVGCKVVPDTTWFVNGVYQPITKAVWTGCSGIENLVTESRVVVWCEP